MTVYMLSQQLISLQLVLGDGCFIVLHCSSTELCFSGTFSSVYECLCRNTNQKYAVKVVNVPRFLSFHSKDQLINETRIAEILNKNDDASDFRPQPHPQLVTPIDSRSEFSKYYMIYERFVLLSSFCRVLSVNFMLL